MRRREREVTETNELLQILGQCKVCRIAMRDDAGLYVVPMNFGYEYADQQLTLYFHSAKTGRKLDAMRQNPEVCFEMDCGHRLITGDTPCAYGYSFQSIVGNGTAEVLADPEQKKKGLALLMRHQTGASFAIDESMAETVCVFRITATSFTGKRH